MSRNEKQSNSSQRKGERLSRPRFGSSKRQSLLPASPSGGGVQLQLPAGKPDIEALRSATREWLVPRLVEKFLRLHGIELKRSQQFANIANRLQFSLRAEGSAVPGSNSAKELGPRVNKKNQYRGLK